jgi:hypothetical protein
MEEAKDYHSSLCAMRKEVTPKPREAMYVSRNIEVRTLYHFWRAEGKNIKLRIVSLCLYPQFSGMQITSFLLLIYTVICVVPGSNICFHISHKRKDFRKSFTDINSVL